MVCLIVKKCNKMSSETEYLEISKVAFSMVGINERFDLIASEIVEACHSMPISRKKDLGKRCLK